MFYPLRVKINKCSGNCNNINDPYARICVPDVIKDLNVKVFNLMSRTNETKFIKWHEKCKCICRLDSIVCNNKQCWNKGKCRCECKELIGACDKGFIQSPSNCECECDKSCDIGKYLDYENCKCRKKLADKLVDEYTKTIEETKLVNITFTEDKDNYEHNSCRAYIALMIIVLTIFTVIIVYLICCSCSLIIINNNNNNNNINNDNNNNISCIKFNNYKFFLMNAII